MEWNSAFTSFIYVHLPLRPATMSYEDLRYTTGRLNSQVASLVNRFLCLSVSLFYKRPLFFPPQISETIIIMLMILLSYYVKQIQMM